MRLEICLFVALACSCALSAEKTMLTTNFENLEVGVATNPAGPTGTTVIHFPKGAIGAMDSRGGAVAVREGSSVDETNTWGWLDAIALSGGSTFGLEAADGVAAEILKLRGGKVKFDTIPAVPAAIVYDFTGRDTSVYPDRELGAKAFKARVKNKVPYGRVGGGTHVSVGKWFDELKPEKSGQGAAYFEKNGIKVLVITVVNAVGNVLDEKGDIIKGSLDEKTGERINILERVKEKIESTPIKGNTTITAVITNVKFDRLALKRLAIMAHTSMAKVIDPFHTPWDGDVLFAVSTREMEKPEKFDVANLGVIASDLLRTAVWRAVGHIE
ncbi:MAG: 6-aminohexanoate hydrolase [Halobacteriovorax sp.]|nr:6-aminohexanoate hydrolase [Halobacteriovorax sp.]